MSQGKVYVRRGRLNQRVDFHIDLTSTGQTGELLLRERKTGPKIVAVLTGQAAGCIYQRAACTCCLSICLLATKASL